MKKIECFISDEISDVIDKMTIPLKQSRAEFVRIAIIKHIDDSLKFNPSFDRKVKEFLGGK